MCVSRITHVSNCCGLGLLFVNENMELEVEEIKNKSYKKCYAAYKRMLKRFHVDSTLFDCVPAMLLLDWNRCFTDRIGSNFFRLTYCGAEVAFSLSNGLLQPSILVWGYSRIIIAETPSECFSSVQPNRDNCFLNESIYKNTRVGCLKLHTFFCLFCWLFL